MDDYIQLRWTERSLHINKILHESSSLMNDVYHGMVKELISEEDTFNKLYVNLRNKLA